MRDDKNYQIIYKIVNSALATLTKNSKVRKKKAHLYTLDFLHNPNNAYSIVLEDFEQFFTDRVKRESVDTIAMYYKRNFMKYSALMGKDEIDLYKKEIYKFLCLIEKCKMQCIEDLQYKIGNQNIKTYFKNRRESKKK